MKKRSNTLVKHGEEEFALAMELSLSKPKAGFKSLIKT